MKKIFIFLLLTFCIDWLIILVFYLTGGKWGSIQSLPVALGYMFIPMVCAIIVQKYIYKEDLKIPLGIHFKINKWWFVAWLLPPLMSVGSLGLSLLAPGVSYSPDLSGMFERYRDLITPEQYAEMQRQIQELWIHPFWITLGEGLLAGISINAIAGFGEELGWRGLLQNELKEIKFWPMSLIIGFIWGVWHSPVILMGHNYPQHPVFGVLMMIVLCILLAPILGYIRIKSNSVIAAAIFHGSVNGTAGLGLLLLRGGNDLTVGLSGLSGFMVLLIINTGIYFLKKQDDKIIKTVSA